MPDKLGIMLGSLILTVLTGVVDIYLTPYFALSECGFLPARHRAGGAAAAGSQQLHAGVLKKSFTSCIKPAILEL